jgi:glyoxylase-like metal-dependent hydrolase (beta-lactamase superfamily II)
VAVETPLLSDGRGRLPSEYVFDEAEPAEVEALLDEPYPSDAPYQCLLVRTDAAVVLVDTGLGAAQHPFGGSGGGLPAELARVGVPPEAVDVVVVTHGHLDHIGGNVSEGAPAFPRARYVMSRADWEFWTSEEELATMSAVGAAAAREHLPPLAAAGVLDLVDGEQDVAPGIRIVPAGGHTPGHLAVEVIGELLYLTDALLHPLQGARPELGHGLDEDPEAATATLRALLGRAAASAPIACSHVDGVFRVEPAGGPSSWRRPREPDRRTRPGRFPAGRRR